MMMKGVGKDASSLFSSYHKWVAHATILARCRIGTLKD
jgi:hypothetical protein